MRVGSQSYKILKLPSMMMRCVFGHNTRQLAKEEIIKQTSKWCCTRIALIKRLSELFVMSGLNSVGVAAKERAHHFGGGIIIKKINTRRAQLCCMIDETTTSLHIIARGNK